MPLNFSHSAWGAYDEEKQRSYVISQLMGEFVVDRLDMVGNQQRVGVYVDLPTAQAAAVADDKF